MIKIENTDVYGFEAAIRGMRNPWNSWKKSDSEFEVDCVTCDNPLYPDCESCPVANNSDKSLIGTADLALMKKAILAAIDADLVLKGMINPVAYIFRAKNYYGMKDQQDVVVQAKNIFGADTSREEIERRLTEEVVIEATTEEPPAEILPTIEDKTE